MTHKVATKLLFLIKCDVSDKVTKMIIRLVNSFALVPCDMQHWDAGLTCSLVAASVTPESCNPGCRVMFKGISRYLLVFVTGSLLV